MQTINPPPIDSTSLQPLLPKKEFSKPIVFILILCLLTAIGILIYQNLKLKQNINQLQQIISDVSLSQPNETPQNPSPTTTKPIPTSNPTADWQTYKNENYGFTFKYPHNFIINSSPGGHYSNTDIPIVFSITLKQNIYTTEAQFPVIRVQILQTNKIVTQLIDDLKTQIENTRINWNNPENVYYDTGADPPKINNIETTQIGNIEFTKVDRYGGPGAPDPQILEFFTKLPNYILVFTANYGTYNPDVNQDGAVEKETLLKIIPTFNLTAKS